MSEEGMHALGVKWLGLQGSTGQVHLSLYLFGLGETVAGRLTGISPFVEVPGGPSLQDQGKVPATPVGHYSFISHFY